MGSSEICVKDLTYRRLVFQFDPNFYDMNNKCVSPKRLSKKKTMMYKDKYHVNLRNPMKVSLAFLSEDINYVDLFRVFQIFHPSFPNLKT